MNPSVITLVLLLCVAVDPFRVITEEESNGINEVIINGGEIETMWINPRLIPATPDEDHLHISLIDYLVFNANEYTTNGTKKLVCKSQESWRCEFSRIQSIHCEKKGKDDTFRTIWRCEAQESVAIVNTTIFCDRHDEYPDHILKGSCRAEYHLNGFGVVSIGDIAKYAFTSVVVACTFLTLIHISLNQTYISMFIGGFVVAMCLIQGAAFVIYYCTTTGNTVVYL
jgi:hypothetical protein